MPKVPKTLLDKIIVDKALDRASRLRNQMLERGMTPSEIQLYKRRLARLKEELAPHNRAGYFETQYHGPLTLEDIEGLRTPFVDLEPIGSEIEDPMKELLMNSSDRYDFPVYNWIDKCIYNCR